MSYDVSPLVIAAATQHYTNSLIISSVNVVSVGQPCYDLPTPLQVGETKTHISSASSAETVTFSVLNIQLSLM